MAEGVPEENSDVSEGQEDLRGREGGTESIEDLIQREARSIKKELRIALMEDADARVDNHVHVSNLIDFCPREFALCNQRGFDFNPGKKVYPGLALTFKIGHAIHGIIQKALAKAGLMLMKEVKLDLPVGKFLITGSNDGLLKLMSSERLKIAEIKSISVDEFDKLEEPLINHVCQISLYMWKAEKLGISAIDPSYGFIIYVCKGHKQDPIKVFPVLKHTSFLEGVEAKVEQLKTFSDTGELPNRICTTSHALMAKRCLCKEWCFEGSKTMFAPKEEK